MSSTSWVPRGGSVARQRVARGPLLDCEVLRDVIEAERVVARGEGQPTLVLELDLDSVDVRDRRRVVDEGRRLAERLGARRVPIGWLGGNRVGILLPSVGDGQLATLREPEDYLMRSGCRMRVWAEGKDFVRGVLAGGNYARAAGRQVSTELPVLPLSQLYVRRMPRWKRLVDIVVATLCLIVVSPVLLIALGAVALTAGFPLFFCQERVGWGGKPFRMYKIRTMCRDAEARKSELLAYNEMDGLAFKIEHDPRVTWVGRWLRKLSIDELPQLWNVVRGDMSLVGPRPLPVTDWAPTTPRHCRRHDVFPGITCYWQVSGRCRISFEAWMELDLAYVDQVTLWTDLRLMLRTLPAVLFRDGAA